MKRDFSQLQSAQPYDLLVCGGGIYGAWTAYDAALRGLKVALVEMGDWGGGTSSASTKLIHGGLRYLETYDFRLVKKALTERQLLLQIAPHRVWPLRFGVPLYADGRIGRWMLKAGLLIYDFLANNLIGKFRHRHYSRDGFAAQFSALHADKLRGGFTYTDAQTDDARLVLELVAGAMQAGAVCVNYCLLEKVLEENGRAQGALLQDVSTRATAEIRAKQIVFATGQWSAAGETAPWCRMSKGVHLVLPAVLQEEALLLTAPADGRVFFMIPWYGRTLLGTTDTDYRGDVNGVAVEESEIAYLLQAANHYLKTPWHREDVIASYAGLRVMKRNDKAAPSAVSRDWELLTAPNGVHYSIGGKITSSREDAASIVDTVCRNLGVRRACASKGQSLPWAPQAAFAAWQLEMQQQAQDLQLDAQSLLWLLRRHGRRVPEVFKIIQYNQILINRITAELPFILADLVYCAQQEMAVHLHDLLRRRMPLLILSRISEAELMRLAQLVAQYMGWDEAHVAREVALCRTAK